MRHQRLLKNLGKAANIISVILLVASVVTNFVPVQTVAADNCGPNAHNDHGTCTCDTGYEGNPITGCTAIPLTCGTNAHQDGNACVCDTGFEGDPVAGCTATPPQCPDPNSHEQGNHCECNEGYAPDSNSICQLIPLTCGANAHQQGNHCACDTGYHDDGAGSCVEDAPDFQLNLSHVYCYTGTDETLQGMVEVHFVLLNVPDGVTPGDLTYTYGTISPGAHTGNVWHFTDYLPSGTYDIQDATVEVDGETVNLHNPGVYAGTYNCAPSAPASASVVAGTCAWTPTGGSQTPVTITLSHASLTINSVTYTATPSAPIDLLPGSYPYTWTALDGYTGSGGGTLDVGACVPPPVPDATISCFTLDGLKFKVFVSNTGYEGEIGYATDLDGTIVSLGVIANGGSVQVLIPDNATKLYLYPEDGQGGWGTAIEKALDQSLLQVCESDPIGLNQSCSYDNLNKPYGWTIKNLNAFTVDVTWTYGPDSSPSPITLVGGEEYSFTTAAHDGEAMQVFVDNFLLASAEHDICEIIPLTIAGICAADPTVNNAWTITNDNPFAIPEFEVQNASLDVLGTGGPVPANSSVSIETAISDGGFLTLFVAGIEQGTASAATDCIQTPPPIVPPPPYIPFIPVTGVIPPAVGGEVLIPVTGVDLGAFGHSLPANLFSLSLAFFGLGLVLNGLARKQED